MTQRSDLVAVDPWSRDELYAAVASADDTECVVVIDYGREQLYLALSQDLTYRPPTALGAGKPPALRVDRPRRYVPAGDRVEQLSDAVTVTPEFDILIPAVDWPAPDTEWLPPEVDLRDRPSGHSTGVPGG